MSKAPFSNKSKVLFLLTMIMLICSMILFTLSCFDIYPISRYLQTWAVIPLTALLLCLSIIMIIRKKFAARKALKNSVTVLMSLLAVSAGAIFAFYIWSVTIFGSPLTAYTSPDSERTIVVEELLHVFKHYYTAYPVVFPGFYRLQSSGYAYTGESTGVINIEWEDSKALITVEWFGRREEEEPQIVVDFDNPEPWEPLILACLQNL